MSTSARAVETVLIVDLKPAPRNARTHSDAQIGLIAKSIKTFGFTNPILIDDNRNVIAGHDRLAAARRLGWVDVPCLLLNGMSDAQKRAYLIADNKLAERAGWDKEILAIEFQALLDLDFNLDTIGFDQVEIDLLLTQEHEAQPDTASPDDEIPTAQIDAPVSRQGDLWKLGRHLLLCADARDASSFHHLLGNERADVVFADPPYNVPINGHVSGLGAVRHREFAVAWAKCRLRRSRNFSRRRLATHPLCAGTVRSRSYAWTGGIWRKWKQPAG